MFQPDSTLTLANADAVLAAGLQAIAAGQTEIDLAQLTAVDSATVATLLAWQRAARAQRQALAFRNMPSSVARLAQLYGVDGLLDCASGNASASSAPPTLQHGQFRADLPHH